MIRGRKSSGQLSPPAAPAPASGEVDLNQVVAYNFRRAREVRGWTQEETAVRLEPFLGTRLPQASISAIERAYDGDKRREFDAQEIAVFSATFDVPLIWFFLPPPDDHRPVAQTGQLLSELYEAFLGRADQLDELYGRFRELGYREPDADDAAWERLTGARTGRSLTDFRTRRKEMLLALLDEWGTELDKTVEDLGRVFDHLRLVGIRGLVAENMGDKDFLYDASARGQLREQLDRIAREEGSDSGRAGR